MQNLQANIFAKIPRIRIQSARPNSEIEVHRNLNANDEMDEESTIQTYPGKGKGNGKRSKPKSSIEL